MNKLNKGTRKRITERRPPGRKMNLNNSNNNCSNKYSYKIRISKKFKTFYKYSGESTNHHLNSFLYSVICSFSKQSET